VPHVGHAVAAVIRPSALPAPEVPVHRHRALDDSQNRFAQVAISGRCGHVAPYLQAIHSQGDARPPSLKTPDQGPFGRSVSINMPLCYKFAADVANAIVKFANDAHHKF
jgi:hypothetical protein